MTISRSDGTWDCVRTWRASPPMMQNAIRARTSSVARDRSRTTGSGSGVVSRLGRTTVAYDQCQRRHDLGDLTQQRSISTRRPLLQCRQLVVTVPCQTSSLRCCRHAISAWHSGNAGRAEFKRGWQAEARTRASLEATQIDQLCADLERLSHAPAAAPNGGSERDRLGGLGGTVQAELPGRCVPTCGWRAPARRRP